MLQTYEMVCRVEALHAFLLVTQDSLRCCPLLGRLVEKLGLKCIDPSCCGWCSGRGLGLRGGFEKSSLQGVNLQRCLAHDGHAAMLSWAIRIAFACVVFVSMLLEIAVSGILQ